MPRRACLGPRNDPVAVVMLILYNRVVWCVGEDRNPRRTVASIGRPSDPEFAAMSKLLIYQRETLIRPVDARDSFLTSPFSTGGMPHSQADARYFHPSVSFPLMVSPSRRVRRHRFEEVVTSSGTASGAQPGCLPPWSKQSRRIAADDLRTRRQAPFQTPRARAVRALRANRVL